MDHPELNPKDLEIRPLELAQTLPAAWYTDSEIAQLEQEKVFRPSWQLLGRVSRVARAGDILVDEVNGCSVLVIRQTDGQLKAFHNVCRHRAGPLALQDCHAEQLTCRYHGWTYDLDGRLKQARDFGEPANFQPEKISLADVKAASWGPLVFANLSDHAADLNQHLAGIAETIHPQDPLAYRFDYRQSYDIQCNWKIYVDNYLEGYHVPCLHPGLSAQLDYQQYQTEVSDRFSLQWAVLDQPVLHAQPGEKAFYFFIYPNLMLNLLPGRLQTNLVLPLSADRCRVIFDYYYADDVDSPIRLRDQADSHRTQLEDLGICEQIQKNFTSGAYRRGRLSPRWEAALHDFHNRVRKSMAMPQIT